MKVCTFFGHRDCPESIQPMLHNALKTLIEHEVYTFYVGNQGNFDAMVRTELNTLTQQYPHIQYSVVLAYMPNNNLEVPSSHTLLPEGIELVPPRFAIAWRNNWMLQRSQYVICYVDHIGSSSFTWLRKAQACGKIIYNLAAIYA